MSLDLGSLDGVDDKTRTALQRMARYINQLESALADATKSQGPSKSLSIAQLEQVQRALTSSGSHPLNLTGLTGNPTITP